MAPGAAAHGPPIHPACETDPVCTLAQQLARHVPALGPKPQVIDGSAGRTAIFAGNGLTGKVFLVPSDKPDREVAALELLADSAIPAPRLLGHGDLPEGQRWVLMSTVPGAPASFVDHNSGGGLRFYRRTGRLAARIHATPAPPAFGSWTTAPQPSLAAMADRDSGVLADQAAATRPERTELCQELRARQRTWLPALSDPTPVLVHRDLGPGNILLPDGDVNASIAGVIDWETANASAPAAEFAAPVFFGGASVREFACGYSEGADITAIAAEQIAYFVADRILAVFGTTGGRWNPGLDARAEGTARRLLADDLPGPAGFGSE